MSKSRLARQEDAIRGVNRHPLDTDEFIRLYETTNEAMKGEIRPGPLQGTRPVQVPGVGTVTFNDHPINRMGLCLARECAGERLKARSFLFRHSALLRAWESKQFGEFCREEEDGPHAGEVGLHHALLRAAAVEPLNRHGSFDVGALLAHARALVAAPPAEYASA